MNDHDRQMRRKWVFLRLGSGTPLVPRLYGVKEEDVSHWKWFLKRELAHSRGAVCDKTTWGECDGPLEMHEGIVKKNEISQSVPGWWEIFSEFNCFLLCAKCHGNRGLPRSEFYRASVKRYGEAVDEWLESLPFKHVFQPPQEEVNG